MTSLIACRECDLLQREIVLPPGGTACCSRCGAVLYRNKPDSLDRTLAFTVGAAVLFILGPLVSRAKLSHIAAVRPGIALWSFGMLMFLVAAAAASFEAHDFWAQVAAAGRRGRRFHAKTAGMETAR